MSVNEPLMREAKASVALDGGTQSDYPQVITIALNLPQPMALVSALLTVIAEHAPKALLDVTHPGGWRIEVEAT